MSNLLNNLRHSGRPEVVCLLNNCYSTLGKVYCFILHVWSLEQKQ